MSSSGLLGRKGKRSAMQWLEQGIAAYQKGQYQAALQSLDEALRSDAGLAQAWYLKAASLGKLNRRQEEIRAWTEYLKSKPDDVNAWAAKANAHFQLQTPIGHDEALRCMDRALQLDPDNAQLKLMKRLFQGDQDVLAPLTHDVVRNYNAKAKSLLQAGRAEEAMNFADQVLLVDADLRPPSETHHNLSIDFFGVDVGQGLSDYLLRQAEIQDLMFNPGIDKLTILPAGRPLPNSAEHLGSARMATLAEELKSRYSGDRIVIIDSPSLLTCSDPMVLSRFVDGILLVVESEKTAADDLKRAMELLRDKPVLGTLLNKSKS